jgi:hypothetical protein
MSSADRLLVPDVPLVPISSRMVMGRQRIRAGSVLARAAWLRSCHRILTDKGYRPEYLEMQLGAVLVEALTPRKQDGETPGSLHRGRMDGNSNFGPSTFARSYKSTSYKAVNMRGGEELSECAEAEAAGAYAWFNQWLEGEGLLTVSSTGAAAVGQEPVLPMKAATASSSGMQVLPRRSAAAAVAAVGDRQVSWDHTSSSRSW